MSHIYLVDQQCKGQHLQNSPVFFPYGLKMVTKGPGFTSTFKGIRGVGLHCCAEKNYTFLLSGKTTPFQAPFRIPVRSNLLHFCHMIDYSWLQRKLSNWLISFSIFFDRDNGPERNGLSMVLSYPTIHVRQLLFPTW